MENQNELLIKRRMKWQIDLDNYFNIYSTFIIEGYIDDIQPNVINSDDSVNYLPIVDYLDSRYNEQRERDKKCVIVYDPTESSNKRFDIRFMYDEVEEETENQEERRISRRYSDQLAQHFWDIVQEEEIEEQMIEHNAGGVSLDIARIHYALTENGRVTPSEMLQKFRDFWQGFVGSNTQVSGYIFIIKMASRLLTREGSNNGLGIDELLIFRQLLNISQSIDEQKNHKLIILANKVTDLPMWFTDEIMNPFIKKLTVTKPSKENKEAFFDLLISENSFCTQFTNKYLEMIAENPNYEENIKRKFSAYTNDFTMKALNQYKEYLEDGNVIEDPDKLSFSIMSFKAGDLTNPWDNADIKRKILNVANIVSETIKGQEFALNAIQEVLTRAVTGFDRIDNPSAPRVVLFLAGPTGTGKTEVCKQLAKEIFGSEDRIIRLDMSEYGQEHSDQKLFGAPPGYVGYEEGGKLTNAIKKEPFSLVLFDEIEKAHGKILDKFLQILGDGRLTDGRGETVSFTDSIIVITSNAGVISPTAENYQQELDFMKKMGGEVKPEREINMKAVIEMEEEGLSVAEIYNQLREYLRYNVKWYFTCQLNRTELYGRIEDGIVYYNYICNEAVETICDSKIRKIMKYAKEQYLFTEIICNDEVKEKIIEYSKNEKVRSMGARGIGKAVNKLFNGSLSNFVRPYILGFDPRNSESSRDPNDLVNVDYQVSFLTHKSIECYLDENNDSDFTVDDIKWRFI